MRKTAESVRRQGIIPCERCAYWVLPPAAPDEYPQAGECRLLSPRFPATMTRSELDEADDEDETTGWWPTTYGSQGCGQGLLREDAAPLPRKRKKA